MCNAESRSFRDERRDIVTKSRDTEIRGKKSDEWGLRSPAGCDYLGQRFYTRLEKEVMGKSLIKY